jgi:hypothetical protein
MKKQYLTMIVAVLLPLMANTPTAFAGDSRTDAALKRLDPDTRLAEACNLAAMDRIDHDPNPFHPDHVSVDQFSSPQRNEDALQGSGGAFRSGGNWYRLIFKCTASHDHMKVLSFTYRIGEKIPKSQWSSYNLYP